MTVAGKKLLVLTAGRYQESVIATAHDMGVVVVATDRNPEARGLMAADFSEVVGAEDLEAILAVARKHRVDGVIAEQTDVAVRGAAYAAEQMGLPGIGYDVSVAATDKWLMRERCRTAGIPGPQYRKVETLEDALAAAEEIGPPIVLKPVDAQASRGVSKIWDLAELPERFASAARYSSSGAFLVEEMMTGAEASLEGFVDGERACVLAISDKTKCEPPFTYDLQLLYPTSLPEAVIAELESVNDRVIRAIGISMGLTHAEYIVTERGVRLLEIAARGCGSHVATLLLPAMTGVDPIRGRIRQAFGVDASLGDPTLRRCGALEFLTLPPGRVTNIAGLSEARRIPGVLDVSCNVAVGDRIGHLENGDERSGYALVAADSREEALSIIASVKSMVRIDVGN